MTSLGPRRCGPEPHRREAWIGTWTERSDGTLVNKTSGTDLVDPNSSTTNGTQLTLLHYNTSPAEQWTPHGET
jgi:hypothetical protein